jgi:predicted Ser/Thr protein kinase
VSATEPRQSLDAELERSLRATLDAVPGRKLGKGYQASVHLYATPAGDVVVKAAHASGLLAPLWRRLLERERDVYARLGGVPGVPRCHGLLDGRFLVLEYIEGPSFREHQSKLGDRARFFDELLETLRAMHAAGVAHGDLKRKDNIVVGPGERPYLVDFGIAALRGESRLLNRLVFEPVKQMDYNAWVKLKYQRQFDALSPEDATLYRPLWLERIARWIRIPWQKITLRRPRQRWRRGRRD